MSSSDPYSALATRANTLPHHLAYRSVHGDFESVSLAPEPTRACHSSTYITRTLPRRPVPFSAPTAPSYCFWETVCPVASLSLFSQSVVMVLPSEEIVDLSL